MVYLEIYVNKFENGKGFWKFKNSLFQDQTYVNLVKSNIQKVKEQYAMFPYNPTCIHAVNNVELHLALDDQLFLTTFAAHKRCFNSVLFEREKKWKNKITW